MFDKSINMFETGKVEYPSTISSGIMGPCISIGIYDTKNKNGYMRHQPNCNHDHDMENFIIETLNEVDKSDAKIYVCGASYSKLETRSIIENTRNSRRHIKDLMEKYFQEDQVTIKWTKPDYTSELILETLNGRFTVEVNKIDYIDEGDDY